MKLSWKDKSRINTRRDHFEILMARGASKEKIMRECELSEDEYKAALFSFDKFNYAGDVSWEPGRKGNRRATDLSN